MNTNFDFYNPTHILFGSGKLDELGNQPMPGKKALLLISSGKSAKVSGALERTQAQLEKAGVEYAVCAKIHENPTREIVMEAAAFAKENGCDFIVALGGGAVLDSSVAVAAMATNPGDLWDYVNGGTGKGQPLTEVMMSNGVNILSETLALSAIENIAKYLPRAAADGNDIEARERVAYGSTIAGITMQLTSTTAQHSMEHAMSAYHPDLPHGAGLIMISVEFARYFIERHACDGQFIKMAKAMGMPEADKAEDFLTALVQLQKDCGVADLKMSDYGFAKDECMTLAVNARETMGGLFLVNPCEMSDEECAGIFEKAYR